MSWNGFILSLITMLVQYTVFVWRSSPLKTIMGTLGHRTGKGLVTGSSSLITARFNISSLHDLLT